MLQITVPATELWDEKIEKFIDVKSHTLQLEHSLVSLSKWESKWHKAFLKKGKKKTYEETIDYVKCMTLTQNVDPNVYRCLTADNIDQINAYIENPMTATVISDDDSGKKNNEVVTSELIYYWMISLNIPFECQKWHLARLITLIRVCSIKNAPPKKMSMRERLSRNAALNEARKKKLNSRG